VAEVRRANKVALANEIQRRAGVLVDPDSMFDVQVKRMHEYKRQHLNALHMLTRYLDLLDDPATAEPGRDRVGESRAGYAPPN
jgi:starch phosphorylase